MPVGAVAILAWGGGVTMQNAVVGAVKTPAPGSSGAGGVRRVAYAGWRTTDERKSASGLMPGGALGDTLGR